MGSPNCRSSRCSSSGSCPKPPTPATIAKRVLIRGLEAGPTAALEKLSASSTLTPIPAIGMQQCHGTESLQLHSLASAKPCKPRQSHWHLVGGSHRAADKRNDPCRVKLSSVKAFHSGCQGLEIQPNRLGSKHGMANEK